MEESGCVGGEADVDVGFAGGGAGEAFVVYFEVHGGGGAEGGVGGEGGGEDVVEDDGAVGFAGEFGESLGERVGLREDAGLQVGG